MYAATPGLGLMVGWRRKSSRRKKPAAATRFALSIQNRGAASSSLRGFRVCGSRAGGDFAILAPGDIQTLAMRAERVAVRLVPDPEQKFWGSHLGAGGQPATPGSGLTFLVSPSRCGSRSFPEDRHPLLGIMLAEEPFSAGCIMAWEEMRQS
jgi:hypothetical protein